MLNYDRAYTIQQKMKELDLDGFLITSQENRQYITGFTGSFGWVLITRSNVYLMTDSRYIQQAAQQAQGCKLLKFEQHSPVVTLRMLMEELDVVTIGVESDRLTHDEFERIANNVRRKCVTPLVGFVDYSRRIKTEEEIEKIAKAEAIGDAAFQHILGYIKEGVTEQDIALELEFFMRRNGAEALSFETIVASGPRSSMPHGEPTDRKICAGDFVTMDFGCKFDGYCSDMTRTIAVGKVDEQQQRVYNLVLEAQNTALQQIKAGVVGKDIHNAALDVFKAAGFGNQFGHGLGHSVGLEIHEKPGFNPTETDVMEENMVITVEPGLYLQNWGGVRIEDLVVVKKDGILNLTHSPKELIIL